MTRFFQELFNEYGIEYEKQVPELTNPEVADYYRQLFWALNLLLYSRNSVTSADAKKDKDYIQCPRCLFHSEVAGFQGHPYNGDANGAYNIARKGLVVFRKIQKAPDPAAVKWSDLKISVDEWDKFTAEQYEKSKN